LSVPDEKLKLIGHQNNPLTCVMSLILEASKQLALRL
jgi:hypothetical protein